MAFDLLGIIAVGLEVLGGLIWLIIAVVIVDLAIMVHLLRRRRPLAVASAVRITVPLGLVVAVAAAVLLPVWAGSSVADLTSLLDYLVVGGAGLAIGLAAGVLLYPPIQWLLTR